MTISEIIDYIFASRISVCVYCGREGADVCAECAAKIDALRDDGIRDIGGVPAAAAFVYSDQVRALVHLFKFGAHRELGAYMAGEMAARLRELGWHADMITYVPQYRIHPERGFNQAEVLAMGVAEAMDIEFVHALRKVRDTGRQSRAQSAAERRANLRDAFSADADIVKDKSILLTDDIVTTGSTLIECAEALMSAGARSVSAAVFANSGADHSEL